MLYAAPSSQQDAGGGHNSEVAVQATVLAGPDPASTDAQLACPVYPGMVVQAAFDESTSSEPYARSLAETGSVESVEPESIRSSCPLLNATLMADSWGRRSGWSPLGISRRLRQNCFHFQLQQLLDSASLLQTHCFTIS